MIAIRKITYSFLHECASVNALLHGGDVRLLLGNALHHGIGCLDGGIISAAQIELLGLGEGGLERDDSRCMRREKT